MPVAHRGQPVWLPVIDRQPGWVQVSLPGRIAGTSGWIGTGHLTINRSPHEMWIARRDARFNLTFDGRVTRSWRLEVSPGHRRLAVGRTFLRGISYEEARLSPMVLELAACTNSPDCGTTATIAADGRDGLLAVPETALSVLARIRLGTLAHIHP